MEIDRPGDIARIEIKAQQKDENRASAYRDALRDAKEFLRLVSQMSDDVPHKKELMERYDKAMQP